MRVLMIRLANKEGDNPLLSGRLERSRDTHTHRSHPCRACGRQARRPSRDSTLRDCHGTGAWSCRDSCGRRVTATAWWDGRARRSRSPSRSRSVTIRHRTVDTRGNRVEMCDG